MSEVDGERVRALLAAFDELATDIATAMRLVRDMPPGHQAFDAATELMTLLRAAGDEASQLRSQTVRRIRDDEKLSLAQLARKIRVSKARVAQMVDAAAPREDT